MTLLEDRTELERLIKAPTMTPFEANDARGLLEAIIEGRERYARLPERIALLAEGLETWRSSARGRTTSRTDAQYAALAALYVDLLECGEVAPIIYMTAELGGAKVSMTQRLSEARSRGLLSERSQGRSAGHLTSRARALLPDAW